MREKVENTSSPAYDMDVTMTMMRVLLWQAEILLQICMLAGDSDEGIEMNKYRGCF